MGASFSCNPPLVCVGSVSSLTGLGIALSVFFSPRITVESSVGTLFSVSPPSKLVGFLSLSVKEKHAFSSTLQGESIFKVALFTPSGGSAGMKQRELIRWYSEQQIQNSSYSSEEELRNEVKKIGAIIEVSLL
ncbi:hypothetical protein V2J09_000565 [Rumex salicifolius]